MTQQEPPLWDDAAEAYVQRVKVSRLGREVPMITVQPGLERTFPAGARWVKTSGRTRWRRRGAGIRSSCCGSWKRRVVFEDMHIENLDDGLIALERGLEGRDPSSE